MNNLLTSASKWSRSLAELFRFLDYSSNYLIAGLLRDFSGIARMGEAAWLLCFLEIIIYSCLSHIYLVCLKSRHYALYK